MKNRVAYFGVFTALALMFSYIETMIPIQFGVPGIKLGLANIMIVIMVFCLVIYQVFYIALPGVY